MSELQSLAMAPTAPKIFFSHAQIIKIKNFQFMRPVLNFHWNEWGTVLEHGNQFS